MQRCPQCGYEETAQTPVSQNSLEAVESLKLSLFKRSAQLPFSGELLKQLTPTLSEWNILNNAVRGNKERIFIALNGDYTLKILKPVEQVVPVEAPKKTRKPRQKKQVASV